MAGDILLSSGRLNVVIDFARAGSLSLDLRFIDLWNDLNGSVLVDNVGIATAIDLLSTDSRGIGDGLKTALHGPGICTSIRNSLISSILSVKVNVSN